MFACYRWYYDPKTQWYYGGNPVEWTQKPTMPSAAMFGTAPHSGGPVPVSSSSAGAAVGASRPGPAAAGSGGSSKAALGAAAEVLMVKKRVITPQAHPLAQVGGCRLIMGLNTEDAEGAEGQKQGDNGCRDGLAAGSTHTWSGLSCAWSCCSGYASARHVCCWLLLLQVGGHAMPVAGKIGGAKGIGLADDPKVRARKLPPDTLTAETWASHGHG